MECVFRRKWQNEPQCECLYTTSLSLNWLPVYETHHQILHLPHRGIMSSNDNMTFIIRPISFLIKSGIAQGWWLTPVLKCLLFVPQQDKQQGPLERPWEGVRGIPQSPPAWVRKDLEPLAASPLELHSVEWEKAGTTIPLVGQDIIDLQTEVWGGWRGLAKPPDFTLVTFFGLGMVSCMDRVMETKKVRKLVPESMSSNPQPEQEERERRWRSGDGGDGMFNVASLCGLKASRVRVL